MLASTVMKTPEERYWEKVNVGRPDECWPWTRSSNKDGYGQVRWEGKPTGAHRVGFFLANGYWPDQVDHTCVNPPCQNPAHLEDVSKPENGRRTGTRGRSRNSKKTHCPKKHPYTEENTGWRTRRNGKKFRVCKQCVREDTHKRRGPEKDKHSGPRRTYSAASKTKCRTN